MQYTKSLKGFLLSPKTVILLIALMGISCLLGVSIPQLTEKSPHFFENWRLRSPNVYSVVDFLQLNRVYTSWWFLILVAVTAMSLSLFVFEQLKILLRSGRPVNRQTFDNFSEIKTAPNTMVHDMSEIKGIFSKKGYRPLLIDKENSYILFSKNRFGKWGTFFFHLGLLLIILAALYALAFQKRGFVGLIQTETFLGRNEDWQEKSLGVFAKKIDLGFQVYLKEFKPTYWENGKLKGVESILVLIDKDGRIEEHAVPVDKPLTFEGVRICQSLDYGYALTFLLERPRSEPIATHFMLDAPSKKGGPFTGKTDFPTTEYMFGMKFYPDIKEPSFYVNNPGVDLVIKEKGLVKFNGRLLLNEKAYVAENTVTLAQIHYWSGLLFIMSQGMTMVYSGFFLSVLGAFLIYFLPFKEIHVKCTEMQGFSLMTVGGRSKKYQALFTAEFSGIVSDIEDACSSTMEKTKTGDKYERDATITI